MVQDANAAFSITWAGPATPNGNVNYLVTVLCQDLLNGGTNFNTSLPSLMETTATVEGRPPFSSCVVTVTPRTGAGPGESSSETVMTPEEGEGGRGEGREEGGGGQSNIHIMYNIEPSFSFLGVKSAEE